MHLEFLKFKGASENAILVMFHIIKLIKIDSILDFYSPVYDWSEFYFFFFFFSTAMIFMSNPSLNYRTDYSSEIIFSQALSTSKSNIQNLK